MGEPLDPPHKVWGNKGPDATGDGNEMATVSSPSPELGGLAPALQGPETWGLRGGGIKEKPVWVPPALTGIPPILGHPRGIGLGQRPRWGGRGGCCQSSPTSGALSGRQVKT